LKARTYTHKVKKAVQSIDDGATTETQTAPAAVKPDSSTSADKKPEKTKKPSVEHVYDWQTAEQKISAAHNRMINAQSAIDSALGTKGTEKRTYITAVVNAQNAYNTATEADKTQKRTSLEKAKGTEAEYAPIKDTIENPAKLSKMTSLINELTSAEQAWNKIASLVQSFSSNGNNANPGTLPGKPVGTSAT